MNKLIRLLGAMLFCATSLVALAATEANRMVEFTFESAKPYQDPFNEITLDAVFTDPSGGKRRVPAFWAGGTTWRVRYASSLTGLHRFQTECSDTSNAGLHGVRGEVTITAYTGQNPLFRHGAIRVANDGRHFAHADGTPFFWLGDTWWMGLVKRLRWPEDFQALTADRRDKGFTVIQLVAGLYPDMPAFDERGLSDNGLPWEKLYTRIRPEYFDAADRRVQHLVEQGLVPCILGAWGYHLPWLGTEKMKQHWRYIIARWGALPVIWCAAGEQAMPWYLSGSKESETQLLRREWNEVIRHIRATDPFHRLVTTHPRSNARDELLDPVLLDFEMQQTGHGRKTEQHAASALEAWNRPPFVPVISGESRYEALEIKPPLAAKEAREAFWAHLLNSGSAGHTYGVNGVWQVNVPEQRFGKSPGSNDWGGTPWRDAMNLPGSTHLAKAKAFLLKLPWHQLAPAMNGFTGAVSAAITADGRCALAYTIGGKPLTVDLSQWKGSRNARWFDPTSGELKAIPGAPFAASGLREFAPPGNNAAGDGDWVLWLEAK
ncbi:MAG TPA: DUF4038 domain-containing protein [Blastocatellia bacterium]|nr:DUF4038 domain-containing protein [Blastocatellia bacterium]